MRLAKICFNNSVNDENDNNNVTNWTVTNRKICKTYAVKFRKIVGQ